MKKGLLLLLVVVIAGCGGNGIVVRKYESSHVRHYSDMQKLDNVAELNNYAGYMDKGDSFPLELNIDNDIVGVKQKSIDLEIKQRLYFMVKVPKDPTKEELERVAKLDFTSMSSSEQQNFFRRYMLFLSMDAEHWAPLYDGRALKKVLEIRKGSFSFGVGMDKDKGVKSVLTVKTEK
jgi:hypothetical protein